MNSKKYNEMMELYQNPVKYFDIKTCIIVNLALGMPVSTLGLQLNKSINSDMFDKVDEQIMSGYYDKSKPSRK